MNTYIKKKTIAEYKVILQRLYHQGVISQKEMIKAMKRAEAGKNPSVIKPK